MKPGRLLIAAASAAWLVFTPSVSHANRDRRIAKLVEESGTALHTTALHAIGIVHMNGRVVASGLSGTGDRWNKMRGVSEASMFSTPPLAGGSGWNGKENWNLDQTGLVIVDGSVLGRSSAINQAYFDDYDLWTPAYGGAAVTWGGSRVENGKSYDVLAVTPPKSSLPIEIWFDRTSHLPVRMVQTAGPFVSTMTVADFRPASGLMVPYRIDTSTSEGNSASFTVRGVAINPADGAAHLIAPTSRPHDFSMANGAAETTVPIRISANHVYMDVMLNGKGPYHFIFDTGGANIVDTAVAKDIDAVSGGSAQIGGVGNGTESSSFATIKTLQVGDATMNDQVFSVLPMRRVGVAAGIPEDGVIGYEVLSRFVTTFDYGKEQVTFHLPGTYTAPAGASVVPFALYGTQPQFACILDDVPTTCTLDTGARGSISLFTPFVKLHPDVVPTTLTAIGVNGFGVGGPTLGKLGRVQSFSFGDLTLHDVVGDYALQTKGGLAMPFIGANIGGAVWKRFTMTLDYHRLTMTLTPNADFAARDHWDRSGIFLVNRGAITIVDVRPGTPAAQAGLAKGDIITAVGGSPAVSLTDVRDTFMGPPGTVVHLVVKTKDGTAHNIDLTLADYV